MFIIKEPYIPGKRVLYSSQKSPIFFIKEPCVFYTRSIQGGGAGASYTVCCSVLQCVQCVAVCCSVLQCVAVCCSVLECVAVCCSVLQCVAERCGVVQCGAVCCGVVKCGAVWCSVSQ